MRAREHLVGLEVEVEKLFAFNALLLEISDRSDLRHPSLTPHSLSLPPICVSVSDHIPSLLCPTTAPQQLIGPGILPEENTLYSIKTPHARTLEILYQLT